MKQKRTLRNDRVVPPRSKLLLLVENAQDYAFITLDPKGKIDNWNKGAQYILGYMAKEVVGKNFARFFTLEARKAKMHKTELEKALAEGHAEDENWLVKKDRSQFWASGITIPIYDKIGNHVGFAKIIRDLTKRRELDQEQQDFIAVAIHELRTPFTVAKLLHGALQKHLEKQHDKKGLVYFHRVSHAFNQMDSLFRDLLNLGRMQPGKIDDVKDTFDIVDLVKEVTDEIQEATNHQIVLKVTKPIFIDAHKSQITEVLTNFITNAVKYSPGKKEIIVTVQRTGIFVQVSVQDFGIGIPRKDINKVFNRFYRTSISQEEKIPGIGLGLYISKKIIENHKGQISVKSTPGKGSTFAFSLHINQK